MRQNTFLPLGYLSALLLLLLHPGFASPKKLQVSYDRSSIVAVTHKSGLLRFLGHEHGILVTAWSADVTYDDAAPTSSRVSIEIPVRALVIDAEEARVKAELDTQGPSPDDITKMQHKMLSEKVFDAEKYPEIVFTTASVEPQAAGKWILRGLLTIRGISQPVTVPVTLARQQEAFNVTGRFRIKQTAYGIKPESIAGVVEVADEVDIQFDIWGRPEA
jgi:polyisoprenoid-binding protein YceI